MINYIRSQIKALIKRCYITGTYADTSSYAITQVKYHDTIATVEVVTPYGFNHCPPVNSLGLLWNINSDEENRAGIFYSANRFKGLLPGEVITGNPIKQSYTKYCENGDIEIITPYNLIVSVSQNNSITINGNATISVVGDTDLTVGGNATITSSGDASIFSPSITLADAAENTTLGPLVLMTPLINYINNHVHSNGNEGGDTGVPVEGLTTDSGTIVVRGA